MDAMAAACQWCSDILLEIWIWAMDLWRLICGFCYLVI